MHDTTVLFLSCFSFGHGYVLETRCFFCLTTSAKKKKMDAVNFKKKVNWQCLLSFAIHEIAQISSLDI